MIRRTPRSRRTHPLFPYTTLLRSGQAFAEVLRGTVNPSGRLPVTFYASTDQLPPFTDYAMANRTYRYFDGKPEYAFGHGLSYTRFAYADLKVDDATVAAEIGRASGRERGVQYG